MQGLQTVVIVVMPQALAGDHAGKHSTISNIVNALFDANFFANPIGDQV